MMFACVHLHSRMRHTKKAYKITKNFAYMQIFLHFSCINRSLCIKIPHYAACLSVVVRAILGSLWFVRL